MAKGQQLFPASCPPSPLHSSRQAAIGLLLHDCPLHRVPETLLPAAIFKIPPAQPLSLSPRSECSRVYRSVPTAAALPPPPPPPPPPPSRRRPRSLVPMDKDGPVLRVEPHIPQTLWPLVPSQSHRPWLQLGSGLPAAPRGWALGANTPGGSQHACPCPVLLEPGRPTSAPTPSLFLYLSLLPPGVSRQLGQASACGSPRHKRQAGDRSTEFFKALMEPSSQDLLDWDTGNVLGTPPTAQHCSCFLFQVLGVREAFL